MGNLLYEGEYKYGKKWNGKMYDDNGKLTLEFKNGNGSGKEYDFLSNLIYEGKYVEGLRNGLGKEFKRGKKIYEGEYAYGEREGKGRKYNEFGKLVFEGEFKDGKFYDGALMEYYKEKLLFEAEHLTFTYEGKIRITIKDSEEYFKKRKIEYYYKLK